MRSKRKLTALSHIQPVECNSTRFNLLCDELCRNYGVILRVAKSKILSPVSVYKCSYRHFNMFLVILTASEDITDQNSYLCPTRLILLLCISLWRHGNLTEIRLVVIF